MHIALFGGSFNPPHVAHVLDVATVLSCVDVDRVWVVPTFQHAFGKMLAPFEQRLAMTRAAMMPFGERVEVSTLERDVGGESRTIHLIDRMLADDPTRTISIIVGSDILDQIHTWKQSSRLLSLARLIVLRRAGYERQDPRLIGPVMPEVSSTEIRSRIGRGDLMGCRGLLPLSVLSYIQTIGLYRPSDAHGDLHEVEQ